jgi:hypothetical protein
LADANGTGAAFRREALERAPRIEPFAGNRPMDEVEVDVREPEPTEAGVERA